MAASIDFSITQACNCKSLTLKELTGAYDATTNLYGWGAPNEEVGDAVTVTFSVTPPGGAATALDISASFPTVTTTFEYTITGAVVSGVGTDANFPSGLYEMTYTVVTGTVTYTRTKQIYLWCTLQCCVDKLFAGIDYDNCGCDSAQIDEALLGLAYLRGIAYHAGVGNYTKANNIKTKLENLCSNSKYCNNC